MRTSLTRAALLLLATPAAANYLTTCYGGTNSLITNAAPCKLNGAVAGCGNLGSYDFAAEEAGAYCGVATVAPGNTVTLGNTVLSYTLYSTPPATPVYTLSTSSWNLAIVLSCRPEGRLST